MTKQFVTIKGTRDGLTLILDDTCAFEDLLGELERVLTANDIEGDEPMVTVTVKIGNRYVTQKQEDQLRETIRKQKKLVVEEITSNVILKEKALQWKEESEVRLHQKIVRSGQVLEVTGDLLLVGDVNPGGKVVASGNIFVMGNLRGIAHAGVKGNKDTIIAASLMAPSQLRIAEVISRSPDHDTEGVPMECGYIDTSKDQIVMDQLARLAKTRSIMNAFERRVSHG
ncbi:septum formation inhibitor [Gracilibacillus halophilus YIM-C55.5]|uniref:Probable septum site-determining protein MinC n=1 Tax=Gracilibacillus halophilus YIM-C55.5 TaxID=1308866 RepID=N4WFA7_9BACI|nr:septum site-determining protein MinC [Gracilibacillus halophilus]ENH97954.1 septum formation inhibitor [Gracilibacillus halophilus YIM-C55.5]